MFSKSHYRKNLWVFSPSELLTSGLFVILFVLSLGAFFADRPGANPALVSACVNSLIWVAWMYFVSVRRPPPFGFLGLTRGLGPWLGLILCYTLMKPLVPVLHPQLFDAELHSVDIHLLGKGPSSFQTVLLGKPGWTDLFSFFYLGLFVWLIGLIIYHIYLRRALYQRFMLGLILVYSGGFLGYLVYPAVGPRFASPQDWSDVQGGVFFWVTQALVNGLGARFDVFPSLHGALSGYLLAWQFQHDRRSIAWGFPLTAAIWLSTLFLGYHYLPDLVSGGLLAWASAWAAPRLEVLAGAFRRSLRPPRVWLMNLTEGHGDHFGKLAGRLSDLIPLGGETSPGFICGGVPKNKAMEPLRQALEDLEDGPFWVRTSDALGSKRKNLAGLKPMNVEQVFKEIFAPARGNYFIVQKALKVSAVGVCLAFPPKGMGLSDVEVRMTSLPEGDVLELNLSPNRKLFRGLLDNPWHYFPKSFPLRGFELFEAVKLTRRLAQRWNQPAEVEWVLSRGKVFVLDARPVKENPTEDKSDHPIENSTQEDLQL